MIKKIALVVFISLIGQNVVYAAFHEDFLFSYYTKDENPGTVTLQKQNIDCGKSHWCYLITRKDKIQNPAIITIATTKKAGPLPGDQTTVEFHQHGTLDNHHHISATYEALDPNGNPICQLDLIIKNGLSSNVVHITDLNNKNYQCLYTYGASASKSDVMIERRKTHTA